MFSSLFPAITGFLYPLTNEMKIPRSLRKSRKTQKPSLIRKDRGKVNKALLLVSHFLPATTIPPNVYRAAG